MEVHIDQNGRTPAASTYVAAGLIAEDHVWLSFEDDWERALQLEPKLSYFQAHEAQRLTGQFAGWTATNCDSRLSSFVDLISLHRLTPLRVSIPRLTFDRVFRGKTSPRFLDQYWIATYAAFDAARKTLSERIGLTDPVRFSIATTRGQQRRLARLAWMCFRARFRTNWPEPLFPSKFVPSLQAANLLAWHMRKADDAAVNGNRHVEPVWQALEKIPSDVRRWTLTEIKDTYDAMVDQRIRAR
jgi:hypothetical protein